MAAEDTFEWFVSTMVKRPDQETLRYIQEQREYLYSLRSEDERQRFVEQVIEELRKRGNVHDHSKKQRSKASP